MSRSNSLTVQLGDGDKERLEAIALGFGLTWGDRPNVSELIKEIAKGTLIRTEWADSPPVENPRRVAILGAIAQINEGLAKLMRLL